MFHFKRFITTAFFLMAAVFAVQAAEIKSFKFSGLKKTKESYLEKVLNRFYGQEADEATLHEIETVLQAEGLFEKIDVKVEDAVVSITLKEKITFIPLPFAMASNDYWIAGVMVMNMNAFGNKTMLMGGGIFSSSSLMGIFAISKPAANKNDMGWSISASANKNTTERKDLYDEDFTKYKNTGFGLGASTSRKITDYTTVSAGVGLDWNKFSEKDGRAFPFEKETAFNLKATAGINHGKNNWNDWFLNSKMLNFSAEAGRDFVRSENFCKLNGSITYQTDFPFTKRLRFCTTIAGTYGKNLLMNSWGGGGNAAVAMLPSNFASPELYGGNTGLELAVKKFGIGLLSLYGNYQLCYLKNYDEKYKMCQGAGGGVRLYLSKIAFPAFAISISKNITTSTWCYSGSIGVSF